MVLNNSWPGGNETEIALLVKLIVIHPGNGLQNCGTLSVTFVSGITLRGAFGRSKSLQFTNLIRLFHHSESNCLAVSDYFSRWDSVHKLSRKLTLDNADLISNGLYSIPINAYSDVINWKVGGWWLVSDIHPMNLTDLGFFLHGKNSRPVK